MPIAIDFGTKAIHLVQGQANKKSVNIRQCYYEPIRSGLVQDGIIREFGGLEMVLRNFLAKTRINDRNCIVTVNGSHIYTRELSVPDSKPKVRDDVVTFEVSSTMAAEKEVGVEYTLLKKRENDQDNMIRVRASAMQKEYIDDYYKLLKSCGLNPYALDLHPNALVKIIQDAQINGRSVNSNTSVMFLDIGNVTTTAYIVTNGEITYSRIMPMGGIDIDRYVSSANLSDESGENQINIQDLDLSLASLRSNEALANAVRPLVTTLNDGIQRIQQFLSGRLQNGKVETIFLFGQTALFKNFEKTLGEAFSIQTELIRTISKVNMPNGIEIAPYINAIGSMLRIDD